MALWRSWGRLEIILSKRADAFDAVDELRIKRPKATRLKAPTPSVFSIR
jgi:hypothetical protein